MTITFQEGIEYRYQNRPHETDSTFIVVKIDLRSEGEKIIHIFIKNLKMKNEMSKTGYNDHIAHLPFDENTLKNCTIEEIGQVNQVPPFQEGYQIWLEGFEKGKAGVFKIPLSQSLDFVESMMIKK